jgi:hypothetical protein
MSSLVFAPASAGELVAGMAQVVNVEAFHADSGERRNPDPAPEVGVRQSSALRENTGRNRGEMLAQIRHDQVCEVDHAAASP